MKTLILNARYLLSIYSKYRLEPVLSMTKRINHRRRTAHLWCFLTVTLVSVNYPSLAPLRHSPRP